MIPESNITGGEMKRFLRRIYRALYPMHVALVGNGPINPILADKIDAHDIVIRFNRAQTYGASGTRCDVLVLAPNVIKTQSWHPEAFDQADAIWVRLGPQDNSLIPAPYTIVDEPHWLRPLFRRLGAAKKTIPSTAAIVAAAILDEWSNSIISLYGFSHEGEPCHDWNVERVWFDRMVAEGCARRIENAFGKHHSKDMLPLEGVEVVRIT